MTQTTNILPGRYNVSIVKKSLCWQEESFVVEASVADDSEAPAVVFSQSGFRLSCDISHDTELNFEMEKEAKTEVLFANDASGFICLLSSDCL